MLFQRYKPTRTLNWLPEAGSSIEMEICILKENAKLPISSSSLAMQTCENVSSADCFVLQFDAPLIEAQILMLFLEKGISQSFCFLKNNFVFVIRYFIFIYYLYIPIYLHMDKILVLFKIFYRYFLDI